MAKELEEVLKRIDKVVIEDVSKHETEQKRRLAIMTHIENINKHEGLKSLKTYNRYRKLLTGFEAKVSNRREIVYGIPLIGNTSDKSMLAYTEAGIVEWIRPYELGEEAGQSIEFSIKNDKAVETIDLSRYSSNIWSQMFKEFFASPEGSLSPDEFGQKIAESLQSFAEKIEEELKI